MAGRLLSTLRQKRWEQPERLEFFRMNEEKDGSPVAGSRLFISSLSLRASWKDGKALLLFSFSVDMEVDAELVRHDAVGGAEEGVLQRHLDLTVLG